MTRDDLRTMGALVLAVKLTSFFGCGGDALVEELFSFSALFMDVVDGMFLSTMDADLTGPEGLVVFLVLMDRVEIGLALLMDRVERAFTFIVKSMSNALRSSTFSGSSLELAWSFFCRSVQDRSEPVSFPNGTAQFP